MEINNNNQPIEPTPKGFAPIYNSDELEEEITTRPINIDQTTKEQDYLEIANGTLKVASIKHDITIISNIALQLLESPRVQELLKISNHKTKPGYC